MVFFLPWLIPGRSGLSLAMLGGMHSQFGSRLNSWCTDISWAMLGGMWLGLYAYGFTHQCKQCLCGSGKHGSSAKDLLVLSPERCVNNSWCGSQWGCLPCENRTLRINERWFDMVELSVFSGLAPLTFPELDDSSRKVVGKTNGTEKMSLQHL